MSGVLEVPAFVIGLSGVITLAEKSLVIWQSLAESREFGNDMVAITAKLAMEYYRFLSWARVAGALQGPPTTVLTPETVSGAIATDLLRAPVEAAVAQIAGLLDDMFKITSKYSSERAANQTLTSPPSVAGWTVSPSVGLGLSVTLPLLGVPHNTSLISKILQQKNTAEVLRRKTSFSMRFTFGTKPWGIPDKTALEQKLEKLCYWNDRLEAVIPVSIQDSLRRHGLASHVLLDDDNAEKLKALMEASKNKNEGVRAHANFWKERLAFEASKSGVQFDVGRYRIGSGLQHLTEMSGVQPSKSVLSVKLYRESADSAPFPVATEWYSYQTLNWDVEDVSMATRRLASLVHLSSLTDRPDSLRILNGICFVERESSLGLVSRLPDNANKTLQPVSLHGLLEGKVEDFRRPDLDQRLQLAQQLAGCVYSFGLVRWFHKDFSSRNVVFFQGLSGVLFDSPFVVGFSVSRPDSNTEKSFNKDLDALSTHLHPDLRIKSAAQRPSYHRKYEMYSLGLVLLEIGMWRPISKVIDGGLKMEPSEFKKTVVGRCREKLGFYVGPKYRDVVLHCLTCADQDVGETASSLNTLYWTVVLELAKLR